MKTKATLPVLLLALLAAACGDHRAIPDASPGAPVELTFWNGFSGPDGKTMARMVDEFNASHPGIRVKMQIIPWGTYYDKVTLGLAFGGAPDVLVLHATRLPEYASNDAIADLSPEIAAGDFPVDDFKPRQWRAAQYEGKNRGIPLDCHPAGLYYNLDLFREAGIAKPPVTYAEFLDAARKLTKKTAAGTQWGFAYTNLGSNGQTILAQFGSGYLTPDLTRSDLDSPAARAAMVRMREVWQAGVAPRPEGQDAWQGFLSGRVAMAIEGIYMKSGLDEKKGLRYAGAPVPQFGPKRAVWAGSHVLTMPKDEPPRKRAAAVVFMRYLSDHSLEWAKGGQVPVRRSILESAAFRALPVQYQFSRQLDYVAYEPPSPLFNQIAPFAGAAVEASVNDLEPLDVALKKADRRIDNVMERR